MRQRRLTGLADQGRSGGVGLPAAPAAAGAGLTVQHQQHMPRFPGAAPQTGENFSTGDDAAAHAGSQRNEHHILTAHGAPGHHLRQSGAVGIVAQPNGDAEPLVQHPAHRYVEPVEVIGPLHHPRLGVAGTGGANTHRGAVHRREPRLPQSLLHGVAHVPDDLLRRALRPGGDAAAGHDLIAVVHHAYGDVGAAQINTDAIHENAPLRKRERSAAPVGLFFRQLTYSGDSRPANGSRKSC